MALSNPVNFDDLLPGSAAPAGSASPHIAGRVDQTFPGAEFPQSQSALGLKGPVTFDDLTPPRKGTMWDATVRGVGGVVDRTVIPSLEGMKSLLATAGDLELSLQDPMRSDTGEAIKIAQQLQQAPDDEDTRFMVSSLGVNPDDLLNGDTQSQFRARNTLSNKLRQLRLMNDKYLQKSLSRAAEAQQRYQSTAVDYGSDDAGTAKKFAEDLMSVSTDMIPMLIATYVTGGGAAAAGAEPALAGAVGATTGAGIMGSQVLGQSYLDGLNMGLSPEQAGLRAQANALMEFIPEMKALQVFSEKDGSKLMRILKAAGAEGLQEMVTQAGQSGLDWATGLSPDMTWEQYLKTIGYAGALGAGAGGTLRTPIALLEGSDSQAPQARPDRIAGQGFEEGEPALNEEIRPNLNTEVTFEDLIAQAEAEQAGKAEAAVQPTEAEQPPAETSDLRTVQPGESLPVEPQLLPGEAPETVSAAETRRPEPEPEIAPEAAQGSEQRAPFTPVEAVQRQADAALEPLQREKPAAQPVVTGSAVTAQEPRQDEAPMPEQAFDEAAVIRQYADQAKTIDALRSSVRGRFGRGRVQELEPVVQAAWRAKTGQAEQGAKIDAKRAGSGVDAMSRLEAGRPERNASVLQPVIDRVLADTDLLRDRADSQPQGVKSFDSLGRDVQHVVLSKMVSALDDSQVLKAVVESVPIDVMNILVGKKFSSEMLLHDKAMLRERLSIPRDEPIPKPVFRFIDSLVGAVEGGPTSLVTEVPGLGSAAPPMESVATVGTGSQWGLDAASTAEDPNLSGAKRPTPNEGGSTGSASKRDGHVKAVIAGQEIEVNVNPSDAQKEAGVYKKGHVTVQGLDITIENPKGSERSGTDPSTGKPWSVTMQAHYGYIKRTEGADGEHVDVFLGEHPDSDKVFVVDQMNRDGSFDEHKIMLGYTSKVRAKRAYKSNYSDDWKVGPVTTMSVDEFKTWLKDGDNSKPVSRGIFPEKSDTKAPADETKPAAASVASQKIEDFGEKLGGARKDLADSYSKTYSDDDLAGMPLSKIWPKEETATIEDPYLAAFATAARDAIPTKPKLQYKLDRWVEKVKLMRGLMASITEKASNGRLDQKQITNILQENKVLRSFGAKVKLLAQLDRSEWDRVGEVLEYPNAYTYEDGKQVPMPQASVTIDSKHHRLEGSGNIEDHLGAIRKLLVASSKQVSTMKFEVRGRTGNYTISKKGDREYRALKKFTDPKDAFQFIKDHHDELVQAWEAVKDSDNVRKVDTRREENRPRTGVDHRQGKDVTPEQFAEQFGFRGVEFGNWVSQGNENQGRQGMLNQAYDALMDLASLLDIEPPAISLNGTLGLGFGSRGSGRASAHFEPGLMVINLTKTRGAGSLAHEWFHALDNYFARMRTEVPRKSRESSYITYRAEPLWVPKQGSLGAGISRQQLERYHEQNPKSGYYNPDNWKEDENHPAGVRPVVEKAFAELVHTLDESPMHARAQLLDKTPDGYWSRIIERAARSFENYVIAKMAEAGYNNDYLANVTSPEQFRRSLKRYPYLLQDEIAPVQKAFDNLFSTLDQKTTEQGIALYSRRVWQGNPNTHDFIVPETPEFKGNESGDLATMPDNVGTGTEALPIRLTVGQARAGHKGFGLMHIDAESESDPRRQPPAVTNDKAENIARQVADIARSFNEVYEEGGARNDRFVLRNSQEKAALVVQRMEDQKSGEPYYSVISLVPSRRPAWGNPIWRAGRGEVPASEVAPPVAPDTSAGSNAAPQPASQSRGGVQTERFDLATEQARVQSRSESKAQPKIVIKKRRTFNPKDLKSQRRAAAVEPYTRETLEPAMDKAFPGIRQSMENAGLLKIITADQLPELKNDIDFSYIDQHSMRSDLTTAWLEKNGHKDAIQKDGSLRLYQVGRIMFPSKELAQRDAFYGDKDIAEVTVDPADVEPEGQGLVKVAKSDLVPQAFVQGGVVHLIADNIDQSTDVKGLMLHEIGVHLMRLNEADEEFDAIKQRFQRMVARGRPKALAALESVPANTPKDIRAEEALGYFVEQNPNLTLSRRFVAWIRAKLRHWFRTVPLGKRSALNRWANELTEDDLIYMASSAVQAAKNPEIARAAAEKSKQQGNILNSTKASHAAFEEENRRIREDDITLWNKAKTLLRKEFAPGGLLPRSVFNEKIFRDGNLQDVEMTVQGLVVELERAIRKDYGVRTRNLSENDLRTLSDALAGKMPKVHPNTKVALVAMRQYIDHLSGQYTALLQNQVDNLSAELDAGEHALLKGFIAAGNGDEAALDEAKDQARQIWGSGKPMQRSLVKVADIAERMSLMQTVIGNQGQYVHRSYQVFDDPKWYKRVSPDVLNAAREYLIARSKAQGSGEAEATARAEIVLDEILKSGTAYDSIESFIKESKLGAKDLSVLKHRKQIGPEIRALMGEYIDPRVNFAKTATKMGRLIFNQVFLDKVLEHGKGVFLFDERQYGTEQIAADGSEVYAPLNGLYAPRETIQAFKDALGREQMGKLVRFVIQVNGMVKGGKTVFSPTTTARNFQSAMFFAIANGHFDIREWGKAWGLRNEYFSKTGEPAKLEYLKKLKRLGVIYDVPYAEEMMDLVRESKASNLFSSSAAQDVFQGTANFARSVYSFGDDFWKISGYEQEKAKLMKYGNMNESEAEAEAADRIRNMYPTYSMVGRSVQRLRRFPLVGSFVSFPAEIIRTSSHLLKTTARDFQSPGMRPVAIQRALGMAMVAGFAYAAQEIAKAANGFDDDDEEAVRLQAAPWQKNSNIIFTGRDADGNVRYIDISFLDPYNYWKRPITAFMRDQPVEDAFVSAASDMLQPFFGTDILAGTIMEIYANKKESGGQVYKETDSLGQQLVDIAGHLRKAVQPGIASNLERTWQALEGETSRSGKQYNMTDEGLAWLGWRVSTLDPKVALYYRSFDFADAKSDASKTLTQVLTDPNKVSQDDIYDAYALSLKMRKQAYEDMITMINASRRSGMTDTEISTTLRGSSVSKADIRALLAGEIPAWTPTKQSETAAVRRAEAILSQDQVDEIRERYRAARERAVNP